MKQTWLEKDGTLQVLTDENLDGVKRVLVTQKGSIYGSLYYPDEKPKGKWTNDGGPFLNRWICSECGYKHYLEPTKFCVGCGSEMTEEEDGND